MIEATAKSQAAQSNIDIFWNNLATETKNDLFTWATMAMRDNPNHPNYHLLNESLYWKSYKEVVEQSEPDLNSEELSKPTVRFIIKPAKEQPNFTFFNTVLPVTKLNKQSYTTYEEAKATPQSNGRIYTVLQYTQQNKLPGVIELSSDPEKEAANNSFIHAWAPEKSIYENIKTVFGNYQKTAEKFRIVSRRNLHQGKQAGLILQGLTQMENEPENYSKIIALLAEQRNNAGSCNSNGEFASCINFALRKIADVLVEHAEHELQLSATASSVT